MSREEQLFMAKSLMVFEGSDLADESSLAWKFSARLEYQSSLSTSYSKFAFTHNIVFFCNGLWSFWAKLLPLVLGFFLAIQVIMFQWLAWLLCILLLVNW